MSRSRKKKPIAGITLALACGVIAMALLGMALVGRIHAAHHVADVPLCRTSIGLLVSTPDVGPDEGYLCAFDVNRDKKFHRGPKYLNATCKAWRELTIDSPWAVYVHGIDAVALCWAADPCSKEEG